MTDLRGIDGDAGGDFNLDAECFIPGCDGPDEKHYVDGAWLCCHHYEIAVFGLVGARVGGGDIAPLEELRRKYLPLLARVAHRMAHCDTCSNARRHELGSGYSVCCTSFEGSWTLLVAWLTGDPGPMNAVHDEYHAAIAGIVTGIADEAIIGASAA